MNKILPFIKPRKDGSKSIRVFEHTLGEFGSYHILIKSDNEYDLTKFSTFRERTEKSFDTLEKCLRYVQEHHYYETDEED